MVNRADVRELNEQSDEVQEAMDELEDLYEQDQRSGVTVDNAAYEAAQERAKAAVAELTNHTDEMVDRTDVLEDDEGNTLVTLPNAAVARDGTSTTKPSQ